MYATSVPTSSNSFLNIVVEGCCHGELDQIYNTVNRISQEEGSCVDLLIICGDFQSVRNEQDLACLACPPKYRKMNTFYKYYSGSLKVEKELISVSLVELRRIYNELNWETFYQ